MKRNNLAQNSDILFVSDIPLNVQLPFDSTIKITTNHVNRLIHGLHKFPSKFIPNIPRWCINAFSEENNTILDPFVGSGTTLVEAKISSRNSYGVDIDPLSKLITKVKTTPLNEENLISNKNWLINELNESFNDVKIPNIPNKYHWFKPRVLEELAVIKKFIYKIKDDDIRDFFLVCFSSIIRKVSNADDEGQKTYVYSKNKKPFLSPIKYFLQIIELQTKNILEFSKVCSPNFAKLINKDAQNIELDNYSVDLAITSPPYINAIDYILTQKLEYYWLNLIEMNKISEFRKKYIGTDRVYVADYSNFHKFGLRKLDEILSKIYKKNKAHSFIVYKYFADMKVNLEEVYRVLKHDSRYCVVVGDNTISGVYVPTYELLTKIAEKVGFQLENRFSYLIRNRFMRFPRKGRGGLIKKDWIIILRKN